MPWPRAANNPTFCPHGQSQIYNSLVSFDAVIDVCLVSPLLQHHGFTHGFFTRHGGTSKGLFESLNFATHVGDCPEHVATNFAVASRILAIDPAHIIIFKQVHGVTCRLVPPPAALQYSELIQADAVLSRDPTIACAVRTADCAPILIAEISSGMVAAVHAGWRGVQQNIVAHAVEQMKAFLRENGALDLHFVAAIGPHIEQCCFEVQFDVAQLLSACAPDINVVRYGENGKYYIDLRTIIAYQLQQQGINAQSIDHVHGCTCHQVQSFFSYRRDGWKSGRLLSAIVAQKHG